NPPNFLLKYLVMKAGLIMNTKYKRILLVRAIEIVCLVGIVGQFLSEIW
ncbi:8953_t:CDS:2, partial [Funneliformis geosporum]